MIVIVATDRVDPTPPPRGPRQLRESSPLPSLVVLGLALLVDAAISSSIAASAYAARGGVEDEVEAEVEVVVRHLCLRIGVASKEEKTTRGFWMVGRILY